MKKIKLVQIFILLIAISSSSVILGEIKTIALAEGPRLFWVEIGEIKENRAIPISTFTIAQEGAQGKLTAQISHTEAEMLTDANRNIYLSAVDYSGKDIVYEYRQMKEAGGKKFYSYTVAGQVVNRVEGILFDQSGSTLRFTLKAAFVVDKQKAIEDPITGANVEFSGQITILPKSDDISIASATVTDAIKTEVSSTSQEIYVTLPYDYFKQNMQSESNPLGIPKPEEIAISFKNTGVRLNQPLYDARLAVRNSGKNEVNIDAKITTEKGTDKTIKLKFVEENPILAFSLSGQSGSTTIDHEKKLIWIQLNKGEEKDENGKLIRKVTFALTNAFTELSMKTELNDYTTTRLQNGMEYDFVSSLNKNETDGAILIAKDTRTALQGTYQVEYRIMVQTTKNSENDLKSFAIGANAFGLMQGEIRKDEIKAEIGGHVNPQSANIQIIASKQAIVEFPLILGAEDFSQSLRDGKVTTEKNPANPDTYIIRYKNINITAALSANGTPIRIRSENEEKYKVYTLKIKQKFNEAKEAKIFAVEIYTGKQTIKANVIHQNEGNKINIPITADLAESLTDETMQNWAITIQTSGCAQTGYFNGNMPMQLKSGPLSLRGLIGSNKVLPSIHSNSGTVLYAITIRSDGSTNSASLSKYEVAFSYNGLRTGSEAKEISLSAVSDLRLIEHNLHNDAYPLYKAEITGDTASAGLMKKDYAKASQLFLSMQIDSGARAFYFDGQTYHEIVTIEEGKKNNPASNIVTQIDASGTKVKGSKKIIVINEQASVKLSGKPTSEQMNQIASKDLHNYYLVVYEQESSNETKIEEFYIETGLSGSRINAEIRGNALFLNLKSSYANGNIKLYPKFKISPGAVISAKAENTIVRFTNGGLFDQNNKIVDSNSNAYLTFREKTVTVIKQETNLLTVTSADGKNATQYQIFVDTIEEVNHEAKILSFFANKNASAISGKKIYVYLPESEMEKELPLTFETSPMAQVTYNGIEIFSGKAIVSFNKTKPVKLRVTAEDKKSTTEYELYARQEIFRFSDVQKSDWYYAVVSEAVNQGIVKGATQSTYYPSGDIKRGDFTLMVVRMLGVNVETEDSTGIFTDVPNHAYYAKAIAYAKRKALINGFGDGTFKPEAKIKRQEVAAILAKILNLDAAQTDNKLYSDHNKIPNWATGYIYTCSKAGVILGDAQNQVNPEKLMTRAEAAAVIIRSKGNL